MNINHEQFEAHVYNMIRKHQIASNELDERQLAEAIKQALLSGDFTKYVRVGDGAQTIAFIPFLEASRLSDEVTRLQKILEENGIDYKQKLDS